MSIRLLFMVFISVLSYKSLFSALCPHTKIVILPSQKPFIDLNAKLREALREGDFSSAEEWVRAGASINAVHCFYSASGMLHSGSLLHWAVNYSDYSESIRLMQWLLSQGASTLLPSLSDGTTALHQVAHVIRDYREKANLLLAYNAPIDAVDYGNETVLFKAVFRGKTKLVSLLIARGADPRIANKNGDTPLHIVAARALIPGVQERVELTKMFLNRYSVIKRKKGSVELS